MNFEVVNTSEVDLCEIHEHCKNSLDVIYNVICLGMGILNVIYNATC